MISTGWNILELIIMAFNSHAIIIPISEIEIAKKSLTPK